MMMVLLRSGGLPQLEGYKHADADAESRKHVGLVNL